MRLSLIILNWITIFILNLCIDHFFVKGRVLNTDRFKQRADIQNAFSPAEDKESIRFQRTVYLVKNLAFRFEVKINKQISTKN